MGDHKVERGRGLGPFTGRQLTTIIVVVAVMIMLPVGAFAVVSGSNSFVTDPVSGVHASVNGAGQLSVAPAGPKSFFQKATFTVDTPVAIATPPAGKALVITSVEIDTWKAALTGSGEYLALQMSNTNATCGSLTSQWTYGLNPASVGPTTVPFQPGVVVSANRSLCATNGDSANLSFDVYVYGYLIAAAQAPVGHAVIGAPAPHMQHR